MKIILDMIKSKKEYEESKKAQLLSDYREAINNGDDVVALLLSEHLREINHTLDYLTIQEQIIANERNYYEFTFDLTGANKEYNQIKSFMISHGFDWYKDSDYITTQPITQTQMMALENAIKQQFPWFLGMSTKIYDAIIHERSDVRERWLREETLEHELQNKLDITENNERTEYNDNE